MNKIKLSIISVAFLFCLPACLYGISPAEHSIASIRKISDNADYNVYTMMVFYDYYLDNVIASGITDDRSFLQSAIKAISPDIPINITLPNFGCSAMIVKGADNKVLTGRNYDFRNNTSAMLIRCRPANGYKSIALCALDNLQANDPLENSRTKQACLLAPYMCLDGMNEKGVTISVLTLDCAPTRQRTGKPGITTSLAIRLVLDRAATTEEAIALLKKYDMIASANRDYHFYITDAAGNGCVVEYDCNDPERKLIATRVPAVTNFFCIYADKVRPNQKNGIYGHGRERYDVIRKIQQLEKDNPPEQIIFDGLKAASQKPDPQSVTSNTQWSALYNNSDLTLKLFFRRKWDQVFSFSLNGDSDRSVMKLPVSDSAAMVCSTLPTDCPFR